MRASRTPTLRDIGQEEDVVSSAPNTGSNPSVALAFYLGAYFGIKVAIKELKEREKQRQLLSATSRAELNLTPFCHGTGGPIQPCSHTQLAELNSRRSNPLPRLPVPDSIHKALWHRQLWEGSTLQSKKL